MNVPHPVALEAQIIELPANGLAGGGGGSPVANRDFSTSTKSRQPPSEKPSRKRLRIARARAIPPSRRDPIAAPEAKTTVTHIPAAPIVTGPAHSQPSSAAAPPGGNRAGGEGGVGSGIGTGLGNGVGPGSGKGHGGNFGSGAIGPTAIYAPVPTIPDDMRDEVLEAAAVAHFRTF
jgi:protein TonB